MLTAGIIADFVAPFLGLSYPNDQDRIFKVLSLTQNRIWQSGKFHNSTKYFYVKVRGNNTIITPHGYNVLLGCNVNFNPVNINSTYALFHRNGPAESPMTSNNFHTAIQYLGDSPVIYQPNEEWVSQCTDELCCDRNYFITVVGTKCSEKAHTIVSALGCGGKPIYTYYKEETGDVPVVCDDTSEYPEEIKYHEGVRYPIIGQKVFYKDIIVTNIYNILKEPSQVPVEYFLTDSETGVGVLTARLEPYEMVSKYKRYQISGNNCIRKNTVLGLFKRSKPVDIVDEAQIFISDNKDAILSIAQGFYYIHFKEDIATGNAFINNGLVSLREELREESPNTVDKLQIESIRDFTRIPNF